MPITLHWWIVPSVLVAVGIVYAIVDERRGGYGAGLLGGVVLLACVAAAIAFTAGHYLS